MLAELCYQLDLEEQVGESEEKNEQEMHSDKDILENLISNYKAEINHAESQNSSSVTRYVEIGTEDMYRDFPRLLESEPDSEEEDSDSNEANQVINLFEQRTPVFDLFAMRIISKNHFRGACVDTGAQKSVIGIRQAEAYCKKALIPFEPKVRQGHRL